MAAKPDSKEKDAAAAAPAAAPAEGAAPAKKGGGLKALLPVIAAIIIAPGATFAVAQFVLLPKLKAELAAGLEAGPEAHAAPAKKKAEGEKKEKGGHGGKEGEGGSTADTYEFANVVVNLSGTMGTRYLKTSFVVTGTNFPDNASGADIDVSKFTITGEGDDTVLGKYDDIISSTFWLKEGPATLVIEGFFASGGDGTNSDVFGFYIEPTYDILPKTLQLVGRYSYANSDSPLGVQGQARYERKVAVNKGLGDSYHALYAGAQYFIYGDKWKLMAGAEWAWLDHRGGHSYDGVTLLTGVRFAF